MVARSESPASRWKSAARSRRRRASAPIRRGRQPGGELQSSAAAAVAPRAAAARPRVELRMRRRRQEPSAASAMCRARSSGSVTVPASSRCTARRFRAGACSVQIEASIGWEKRTCSLVEHDHALADGRIEFVANLVVAAGSRDQLDRRPRQRRGREQTSTVSAGSRARRPPSSSLRLSGTRSGRPGSGLVPVRRSSRPSSSAKNGFPAGRVQTRTSSGRVRLEAESLLQQA